MISVCIATYNGELYIKQQLLSILCQLESNDELIVSDDHSTDNTLDAINSLKDNRIKIYINEKEKGYTRNFENALEKASGDIIFLSDQDDVWMDNKVKKSLILLKDNDFVVSDAQVVDNDLKILDKSNFELRDVKHGFFNNFIKCRYLGACYAFNKKVLKKSLPFPKTSEYIPHDYWLYMVAINFFKVAVINEQLIKYRRHNLNTSSGGDKSSNSLAKKIKIRVCLLQQLFKRFFK
ncbi:MAG: glycosyltransferase [Campylobacteraceae bacterium]|nr:glycosyltransferase [Campylobacteraceae bacterium]